MAKNSLFAILLRSPWWISLTIGMLIALVCLALLPTQFKVVGAVSGLPFIAISVVAAVRQWKLPNAARIAQTQQAAATMAWPAFSALLEQSFQRDGYSVRRGTGDTFDFELERQGRRKLVSARRWKSARIGLESLKALQAAREKHDVAEALCIGLGTLSDNAAPYAQSHGIEVWQAPQLALAWQGLPLDVKPKG